MYVIKSIGGRYWSSGPELINNGYWSVYKENATVYSQLHDVPAVLPCAIATTHTRERVVWIDIFAQVFAETMPFEPPPKE